MEDWKRKSCFPWKCIQIYFNKLLYLCYPKYLDHAVPGNLADSDHTAYLQKGGAVSGIVSLFAKSIMLGWVYTYLVHHAFNIINYCSEAIKQKSKKNSHLCLKNILVMRYNNMFRRDEKILSRFHNTCFVRKNK